MNKQLQDFDDVTDSLTEFFIVKYFGKEYLDDYYFVGSQDSDREVLSVSDFFFNLSDIVDSIRYNATKKQLFDYYDMMIEAGYKNKVPEMNFKNYIKYGKKNKIQKRKSKKLN